VEADSLTSDLDLTFGKSIARAPRPSPWGTQVSLHKSADLQLRQGGVKDVALHHSISTPPRRSSCCCVVQPKLRALFVEERVDPQRRRQAVFWDLRYVEGQDKHHLTPETTNTQSFHELLLLLGSLHSRKQMACWVPACMAMRSRAGRPGLNAQTGQRVIDTQ